MACLDCKSEDATLTIRKRGLCPYVNPTPLSSQLELKLTDFLSFARACFMKFANVKAFKRMENYRLNKSAPGQEPKLLVPVSLGTSSTVLLHILDKLQTRQRSSNLGGPDQGRAGYKMHILNVELPAAETSGAQGFDTLREVYPGHEYTSIPFNAIFKYDDEIRNDISELSGPGFEDNSSKTDQERLDSFLSSLSTATSRTDIEYTLLMRLIVEFAKEQGCAGIIWGHNDSRLAGKVLSDVSKGRGFSLPWQICEDKSPSGLNYNFPLRDLFRSELEIYSTLLPERVSQVIISDHSVADMSTKAMSIDDCILQYIETQGAKYPNIMANVVRTVNKLEPYSVQEDDMKCVLCEMPMADTSEGLAMSTDTQASNGTSEAGEFGTKRGIYCYGCARSCQDIDCS